MRYILSVLGKSLGEFTKPNVIFVEPRYSWLLVDGSHQKRYYLAVGSH